MLSSVDCLTSSSIASQRTSAQGRTYGRSCFRKPQALHPFLAVARFEDFKRFCILFHLREESCNR
ncbi:hypothetical protein AVEN_16514-1, partial [Araneus ventricosus]